MADFFSMPFKSTLARRMFVLFLVCAALPLALITVVSDAHVRQYLEARLAREMRETSRVYETVVFDVLLLFEHQFRAMLVRLPDAQPSGDTAVSNAILPDDDLYFSSLRRYDPEHAPFPPLTISEQDYLDGGQTLLRYFQDSDGSPALAMLARARGGVYYGTARIEYLRERIVDYSGWGGVHMAVIHENGSVIVSSTPELRLPDVSVLGRTQVELFEVDEMVGREPGVGVVNTIYLRGRFGAPNWRFLMVQPRAEAFEPLATFRYTFRLMMLIAVVAICLFMIISLRRYTRQIEVLKEGTEKIRRHDFEHSIEIKSGDEFEQLGQAFNTMTRSLREYQRDLARQNQELKEKVEEVRRAREKERVMHEQLARAEHLESLGQLAGGVAHDFNNLLSGIIGNVDLSLAELPEDAPLRSNLEHIESAARRAADLCRQMLVYAGDGTYEFEPVYLAETIREVGDLMRASIPRRIKLIYEIDATAQPISGDPGQILQVILNFITNAAAAIGEKGGKIMVRAGVRSCSEAELRSVYLQPRMAAGRYAFVEVADNGCGMEQGVMEKIFDPFFTTKDTGHGLGLATVMGIIQAHEGGVKVVSQPGEGATFTVYFPLMDEPRSRPERLTFGTKREVL